MLADVKTNSFFINQNSKTQMCDQASQCCHLSKEHQGFLFLFLFFSSNDVWIGKDNFHHLNMSEAFVVSERGS